MKKLIILLVVIMIGCCIACTSSETKNDNNISSEKDENSAMIKTEDGNLTVKFNDIENYKIDESAEKIIIADKDDDTKFSTVYVIKSSDYDRYMGELKKEAFIANSHSKEAAEDIFFNLDVIME